MVEKNAREALIVPFHKRKDQIATVVPKNLSPA